MTIESIQSIIKGHFEAGKRSVGQLRKAVQADVPVSVASVTRVKKLVELYLGQQVKGFGGTVERIGKERKQYTATGEAGKRLQAVTYGKGMSLDETVTEAMADVRAAWAAGKDEPRNARIQVIVAASSQGADLSAAVLTEAQAFVAECMKRNADERAKADLAKAAEVERRDGQAHGENAAAVARKAAQAAADAAKAAKPQRVRRVRKAPVVAGA